MSCNIFNSNGINVDAYVKSSGMALQPPMILPEEFGEPPNDLSKAEMAYNLFRLGDGTQVDLVGYESVLVSIAILRDALYRESVLKEISSPSREQLDELRAVIDKIGPLIIKI